MTKLMEDYVSFETAKLLKEKGFDWEWSPFYSEQDKDEWEKNNNYNIPNPNYDSTIPFDSETLNVVVPHVSLQMAMKWLREVHNLHIDVDPSEGDWNPTILELENWTCVVKFDDDIPIQDSYEQAVDISIRYCLENLI